MIFGMGWLGGVPWPSETVCGWARVGWGVWDGGVGGGWGQAPTVLQVVPHGPAFKAGIREGDVVTCIDGAATASMTGEERINRILGSADTSRLHSALPGA